MSEYSDVFSLEDEDASQLFITQSSPSNSVFGEANECESEDDGILGIGGLNIDSTSNNAGEVAPHLCLHLHKCK